MTNHGEGETILAVIRSWRGVSLREVERKTGISNDYLSQLERGEKTNPSLSVAYRLSEYFDMPVRTLFPEPEVLPDAN